MYQRIMVPLDGSELAECVLPHVEAIAKSCRAGEVIFVRAVEPFYMPSGGVFSLEDMKRIDAESKKAAESYLSRMVDRAKYGAVKVKSDVITGRAAESLADYAKNGNVDLIIMATHGHSGVSRWVWGSVADHLLRSACVPVLMVRAPGCIPGI